MSLLQDVSKFDILYSREVTGIFETRGLRQVANERQNMFRAENNHGGGETQNSSDPGRCARISLFCSKLGSVALRVEARSEERVYKV